MWKCNGNKFKWNSYKIWNKKRELIVKSRKNKGYQEIYYKICENTMGINLNEIHIKYELKKELELIINS